MNRRKPLVAVLAATLGVTLIAGATMLVHDTFFKPMRITAYFTSATGIYPGDEVRVAGMKVGTVAAIEPIAPHAKFTLNISPDVPIPADAKAVLVAPNLVSARFIQLTPAYVDNGPTMADGNVISVERTAVPVEWDEVKEQLTRLATDLGPTADVSTPAVSRFINSTADALDGNGAKLRQTLAQLSQLSRVLGEGSGNIVDVIKNLQLFVTALRDSKVQIVQFQDRLATLSGVIDDSRSDLDAALKTLSVTVADVQRFVHDTRDKTSDQVQGLADVTQVLADHRLDVENILHGAPTAFANGYNIYNPVIGGGVGTFVFNNFSNPVQFICSAIGGVENITAPETAKLCAQYLGPALRLTNFNGLPFPVNPMLAAMPPPELWKFSEARLAPGGEGPRPVAPESPPAVSAYTGADHAVTANPPGPVSVDDLLLPAEAPAPAATEPSITQPGGTPSP